MSGLQIKITNAGRAAIVNANNSGTDPVTITQVGVSATAIVPAASATALPGEQKRITAVSGDVVGPDTIHLVIRDESSDAYTIRSFALYLGDGTLFAIYGQPDPIIEKASPSLMLLVTDVRFVDVDAADLSFGDTNFLNPPATTETLGVVELATDAEAATGTDAARSLTPKNLKHVLLGYAALAGAAFTGAVRSAVQFVAGAPGAAGAALRAGDGATTGRLALLGGAGEDLATIGGQPFAAPMAFTSLTGFAFNGGASFSADVNVAGILRQNGQAVWHAGNDGAGSGLDADLLDGQQGAYYLPAASYSAGDVLAKLVTVDGAGSGLDADLLRGTMPSAFILSLLDDVSAPAARGTLGLGSVATQAANNVAITGGTIAGLTSLACAGNATLGDAMSDEHVVNGSLLVASPTGASYSGVIDHAMASPFARTRITARGGTGGWGGAIDLRVSVNAGIPFTAMSLEATAANHAIVAVTGTLSATLGMSVAGNTVWHAGNDGAGSGVDADLLDGQHGAYYLPAASYNAADVLAKLVTVDGTGTGLDADLLDGQHGAYYLPAASYNAPDILAKLVTVDGAGTGLDADLLDGHQGAYYLPAASYNAPDILAKLVTVDGTGTGLDADLLDGQHGDWLRDWNNLLNKPGAFPPSAHTHTAPDIAGAFGGLVAQNGYLSIPSAISPSGFIVIQWGRFTAAGNSTTSALFPIQFPTFCASMSVGGGLADVSAQDNFVALVSGSITNTTFIVSNGKGTSYQATFIAIGY